MSSSWLKDYVLEGLGSEIRSIYPLDDEIETEPKEDVQDQARLVQILGRGQGGLKGNETGRNLRSRSVSTTAGNGWWRPSKRGKSPNLAKHTDAWILVSDGSHSAKLYLTTEALKDVFEADNENNNEDNLFKRGCCVMLKRYFLHYGHDVHIKVSSLEPKPGFNLHQGTKTRNKSNSDTSIRPVMEEADVLYGIQTIEKLREQELRNVVCGYGKRTRSSTKIARDWEIAFGRLSKGRRQSISASSSDEEDAPIRVVDGKTAMEDILKLAEAAASTEEAIREWELAKKEFGILTNSRKSNNQSSRQTRRSRRTPTKSQVDEEQEDTDQEQEDVSRMYIQNVLAASDQEESENDGNLSSDEEDERAFETQPTEGKIASEKKAGDDDESESESAAMLQTQPAEEEEKSTKKKRKRQIPLQQQQENSQGSAGIWESVKEQLFEPGRTMVHCVPSSQLPDIDDENMLVTPNRSSNTKNPGSGTSVGTNLTSSTPHHSSGAYYRKYGLSIWLSQNTTTD